MHYDKYRASNTDSEAVDTDDVLQCDMKVSVRWPLNVSFRM